MPIHQSPEGSLATANRSKEAELNGETSDDPTGAEEKIVERKRVLFIGAMAGPGLSLDTSAISKES